MNILSSLLFSFFFVQSIDRHDTMPRLVFTQINCLPFVLDEYDHLRIQMSSRDDDDNDGQKCICLLSPVLTANFITQCAT